MGQIKVAIYCKDHNYWHYLVKIYRTHSNTAQNRFASFSRCFAKTKGNWDRRILTTFCPTATIQHVFNIYANESNKRRNYGDYLTGYSCKRNTRNLATSDKAKVRERQSIFSMKNRREERRTWCFAKWQVVDLRESTRKGEGHGTGVEDRKSLHTFHSLGCLGLCPRLPEANAHHWSKNSGRGQWPWIGLKDANIWAKWLVILLENTVGGGQRFRGYSRLNTTSPWCLHTAVLLYYTHSWHVFLLCARAHACRGIIASAAPLLNSNIIPQGITEQKVW